jgi:hypothetical protein
MAQLSFDTLPSNLPDEIVLCILQHWMEPQELVVRDTTVSEHGVHKLGDTDRLTIMYACQSDEYAKSSLPPYLFKEYRRLRRLSWLRDTKYFSNPVDFYVSLCILFDMPEHFPPLKPSPHSVAINWRPALIKTANKPTNPTPRTSEKHCMIHVSTLLLPQPRPPSHGLERITLDFTAAQFFAMFDVRVPPFDRVPADTDRYLHGTAILLQHCTHLTLVFGEKFRYQHPWYDLDDSVWHEDARLRPHVCDMGVMVNVVMEYAWAHGSIQRVEKLTFEGEHIQRWVRLKWEKILEEWNNVKEKGGTWKDIHRFIIMGREDEDREGVEDKMPMAKWPPECRCKIGCWTLGVEVDGWRERAIDKQDVEVCESNA